MVTEPSRRVFLLGLTALFASGTPVVAESENWWIDPTVWQKIVDGKFSEAIETIDLQLAGYRSFKNAGFVRAKLTYGLMEFAAASKKFESLSRRMRQPSPDNQSLQYSPEVDDVRAWIYFSEGRIGRKINLPQSSPQAIISLLRGDVTRDAYVKINMEIWQKQIADANARRSPPPDDGQDYLIATLVLSEDAPGNLEFIADFAMAQNALIQRDGPAATTLLRRAIASEADNAVEFHIARRQLSDLA